MVHTRNITNTWSCLHVYYEFSVNSMGKFQYIQCAKWQSLVYTLQIDGFQIFWHSLYINSGNPFYGSMSTLCFFTNLFYDS